ncbi:MAG: hypothetical protein LUC92_09935 [Clostridiales bacterium]|nr:hypothetical protein [Clostridiales bacterium]
MPMGGPGGGPGGMGGPGRGPMGGPGGPGRGPMGGMGGMGRGPMMPPPPRPMGGGMFGRGMMPRYGRGCGCLGCGMPLILGLIAVGGAVVFALSCLF